MGDRDLDCNGSSRTFACLSLSEATPLTLTPVSGPHYRLGGRRTRNPPRRSEAGTQGTDLLPPAHRADMGMLT